MQNRKKMGRHVTDGLRRVLSTIVMGILILRLNREERGSVYLCVLTLWLFALPRLAEERFRIRIPPVLEGTILVFIFASEMLGELNGCYVRFPWWDAVLHGVCGFLAAAIGFALARMLNRRGQPVSAGLLAVTAFCFSMTVGVLWELLEWGADSLFGLDMQKDSLIASIHSIRLDPGRGNRVFDLSGISDTVVVLADGSARRLGLGGYLDVGLQDTMGDLLINLLGAAAFVGLAFRVGGKRVAELFIPQIEGKCGEQ